MRTKSGNPKDLKVVSEMVDSCVLMRTRLISRVVSSIYDEELRPFGLNSPQFALLVTISAKGPASRAEIGRFYHQDRSTLTRNLKIMMDAGWIQEVTERTTGRARPLILSKVGEDLLESVAPVWRASQEKAKILLGEYGVTAVKRIAGGILKSKSGA